MKIQRLNPEVVDQIAAGEVVERPAHLIKELVENSLDAGADEIEIEVANGGKTVRVQDNGHGIHKEDLSLACARHATSKIRQSDDLWNLASYGFRGEALASISSVSRLKITSRRQGETAAFAYENEFGQSHEPLMAGSVDGTSVEISELFSNVPARLKFLKSDGAETTQIKNVIKAQALAFSHVEFRFKQNGKVIFFFAKGQSFIERAQAVLGCEQLFLLEHEHDGYKLEMAFSSPSTTFGTSKQIWSFVQNRWVQDRTMMAAVMEAYRSLLMHGEYPFCVTRLSVPKEDVDVNIHPTKSQVKFLENSKIFRFVHHPLRAALEKAPWIDGMRQPTAEPIAVPVVPNLSFRETSLDKTQYLKKSFDLQPQQTQPLTLKDLQTAASISADKTEWASPEGASSVSFSQTGDTRPQGTAFWSQLQVLGQTHLTYILAEGENSLFMIDQHAAHERVAFERLMEGWQKGNFEIQNYLLPLSVQLTSEQVDAVLSMREDLNKMGLAVEQGGPETLLVSSAPSFIAESAIEKSLITFADQLVQLGGSFSLENKIADIFASMACHSVVRAGQALSTEEMESLLKQMDEFALSSYCPHGRNVYVEIPFTKIERDFGRLV